MTIGKLVRRRHVIQASGGLAGILALGRAPAFAQAQPKKLVFADIGRFRKVAQEKVWPAYKKLYPDMWDAITSTPV